MRLARAFLARAGREPGGLLLRLLRRLLVLLDELRRGDLRAHGRREDAPEEEGPDEVGPDCGDAGAHARPDANTASSGIIRRA